MSWLSDIFDYGSSAISDAYDNSWLESGVDSVFGDNIDTSLPVPETLGSSRVEVPIDSASPSFWSNLGDSLLKPQVISTGLQGTLGYLTNAQNREDQKKVEQYTKARQAEADKLTRLKMIAELQQMQFNMQRSASAGGSNDMYRRLSALNDSSSDMINALGNLASSYSRARAGR